MLSVDDQDETITSGVNKKSTLLDGHNDQLTSSSSTLLSTTSSAAESIPQTCKEKEADESIFLAVSSNEDNQNIYYKDSNEIINKPMIKEDIIEGMSTRGGRMIFMNNYGYLFMTETKSTIGWRCVKRNENCKAVIYTLKTTGEFSHWNGKFHSHSADLSDTRKREILSKIKHRVIDEFIPIKVIIEEEYRKANLSTEEKKIMPLPTKIGN